MNISKCLAKCVIPCLVILTTISASVAHAVPDSIEGIWQGDLQVRENLEITIVFRVFTGPDGALAATMDVPIQQIKDLPVDVVTLQGSRLRLDIHRIQGGFSGLVAEAGTAIAGHWQQGGQSLPLELERVEKAAELAARPQEPKRPYPYDDEDVTYRNESADLELQGTLTLPRTDEPVPAVVLITGGGVQDRNETILGHKPYLVLADHLTRCGIAVLRADDRGYQDRGQPNSQAEFLESTSEDFAGDALAGVAYLKTRARVDPERIGLIGHSEGGLVAALCAVAAKDVAFIVLLAAPGQTTEEAHHDQCMFMLRGQGAPQELIDLTREHYTRVFELIRRENDDAVARADIQALEQESFAGLNEKEKKWIASLARSMAGNPAVILTPWLRYLLDYDPVETLAKVACPVLVLAGSKDIQVPADRHLPHIRQALEQGGHDRFTITELPDLNHLFQTSNTGMPDEYGTIEQTFSPVALNAIGDWIVAQAGAL